MISPQRRGDAEVFWLSVEAALVVNMNNSRLTPDYTYDFTAETQRRRENIYNIFCRKKRVERKEKPYFGFLNFAHFCVLCGRKYFLCVSAPLR
jgi:hypothetical protein